MSRTSPELTENGWVSVSASQIGTALVCLRKWAIEKIDGVKGAPHRSARAGTRIHEILETWLRSGTPPNTEERLVLDGHTYLPGLSVQNGLHNLPPPGPHMYLEKEVRMLPEDPEHRAQKWFWLGYIDWGYTTLEDGVPTPTLGDHKSSGDPKRWGLNETTIRTDPQAIIYSNAAFRSFRSARHAYLAWNYFGTRKPYPSRRVLAKFTREEAVLAIRPLDMLASRLVQLRRLKGLRSADVPPNLSGCSAYGGCPYRSNQCLLTPEQLATEYFDMNPNESDLEAKMALALNGTATLLSPPPPVWPPDGWLAHTAPGWYWKPGEPAAVTESDLRARYTPPVVVPTVQVAPAIVMPAIPTLPAIPVMQPLLDLSMVAPALPVVQVPSQVYPNGVPVLPPIVTLPVGMINAPESQGIPQRAELLPEIVEIPGATTAAAGGTAGAAGVQDDLTAVDDRDVLVKVAQAIGLDVKGIRVPGIKDKIRAARLTGAPVIAAVPPVPKQPSLPNTNHVGTQPEQPDMSLHERYFRDDSAVDCQRARVARLVSAFISAHANLGDEDLVRRAISINALIEKLT